MAILRKQQRDQYTVIDQSIFCNHDLSFKAKGLLCQMLSLPDGWEFSVEGLTKLSTDGRSAVTSALNELQKAGYFYRKEVRDSGKFVGVEYVISEVQIAEKPIAENPISEKPISGNHQQSITKESITKSSSLRSEDIYTEFENLWKLYPKKQGKDKAYGYYKRARNSGTTYEEVEQGINDYKAYISVNQIDMQYVKQGSTFFSQKAWNDDWTIVNKPKGRDINAVFRRIFEEHKDDV